MKCPLIICLVAASVISCASVCNVQPNLGDHVWWDRSGTTESELYGFSGLDYIGRLNDTIPNAVSIATSGGAGTILNRFKLDTVRVNHFAGTRVFSGHIRSATSNDVVVWDPRTFDLFVLFGTADLAVFDTALVLHDESWFGNVSVDILVYDLDGDSHDDLLLSEPTYEPPHISPPIGRISYFKGV